MDNPSSPEEDALQDYYMILNVEKTATTEEIKKAYRKQALLFHPDKMKPHMKDEASAHFHLISEAYEVLLDDNKRALYDRYGHAGVKKGTTTSANGPSTTTTTTTSTTRTGPGMPRSAQEFFQQHGFPGGASFGFPGGGFMDDDMFFGSRNAFAGMGMGMGMGMGSGMFGAPPPHPHHAQQHHHHHHHAGFHPFFAHHHHPGMHPQQQQGAGLAGMRSNEDLLREMMGGFPFGNGGGMMADHHEAMHRQARETHARHFGNGGGSGARVEEVVDDEEQSAQQQQQQQQQYHHQQQQQQSSSTGFFNPFDGDLGFAQAAAAGNSNSTRMNQQSFSSSSSSYTNNNNNNNNNNNHINSQPSYPQQGRTISTSSRTTIVNGVMTSITEILDDQGNTFRTIQNPDGTVTKTVTGRDGRTRPMITSGGGGGGGGGGNHHSGRTLGAAPGNRIPTTTTTATSTTTSGSRPQVPIYIDDEEDDMVLVSDDDEQQQQQQQQQQRRGAGTGTGPRPRPPGHEDLFSPRFGQGQTLRG